MRSLPAFAPRRAGHDEDGRSLMHQMPAEQVPTDECAEAPKLRARLAAALQQLPDDQREVFLMRHLGGLSFREIGETVGAPENTVKSRMRYALEKLRQELADLQLGVPLSRLFRRSALLPGGEDRIHG